MHPVGCNLVQRNQHERTFLQPWVGHQKLVWHTLRIRPSANPFLDHCTIRRNQVTSTDQIQVTGARTPPDSALSTKGLLNLMHLL